MQNTQTSTKAPKIKLDFKDSKYATGRRKTSIAKVWLKKGSGKIYVNGKMFSEYFVNDNHSHLAKMTLHCPTSDNKHAIGRTETPCMKRL